MPQTRDIIYVPSDAQHRMSLYKGDQIMKRAGFTLIELSIVLVIIGLIVGGVLVGQELIRAAFVRAQITQIESTRRSIRSTASIRLCPVT